LEDSINSLQQTVSEIGSHGGWAAWRSEVENDEDKQAWHKFRQATVGHDRKNYKHLERKGWRNKRVAVTQLVDNLERWVAMEEAWEEDNKDIGGAEETNWSKTTAGIALKTYEELQTGTTLNEVQDTEAREFHKRGREDEDEVVAAWGESPVVKTEPEKYASKRKRRCVKGITFHQQVFVRTDADIDTLRKSSTFATMPHKTASPTPSILRTGTAPQNPKAASPRQPLPALRLPQSVEALAETPSGGVRRRFRRKAGDGAAAPHRWAVPQGCENINTSFASRKSRTLSAWAESKAYYEGLQKEGEEWDAFEELGAALDRF
jgi:hypothetical protein